MCKIKYLQCSRSQTRFIRWSKKITHSWLQRRQGPGRPMKNILVHRSNSSAPSQRKSTQIRNYWHATHAYCTMPAYFARNEGLCEYCSPHHLCRTWSVWHKAKTIIYVLCADRSKASCISLYRTFIHDESYSLFQAFCSPEQWEKRQEKTLGAVWCGYPRCTPTLNICSHCFSLIPDWPNVLFRLGALGNIPSLVKVLGQNTLNSPKVYNFPVI